MNYNIKRNLKGLEEFKRRREKVIVPAYLLSYDRDRDAEADAQQQVLGG